jgi:hypothetical protein
MFTDAFTSNLIVLSTGVISKTGAWARLNGGNTANTKRHRTAVRKKSLLKEDRHNILYSRRLSLAVTDAYCQK